MLVVLVVLTPTPIEDLTHISLATLTIAPST